MNVHSSFRYLHDAGMVTDPSDIGTLTPLGRFSGSLPLDIQLCRLIAFGIVLGVPEEVVVISAALSQSKSLFRIASPYVHTDPDELNGIIRTTFMGGTGRATDISCHTLYYMLYTLYTLYALYTLYTLYTLFKTPP